MNTDDGPGEFAVVVVMGAITFVVLLIAVIYNTDIWPF